MPWKFGLPSGLAQEIHPYALQPGAKIVEWFEIPEERLQVEPCKGGVRIVSLDEGMRSQYAEDDEKRYVKSLQWPICIPSHIGWQPVVQIGAVAFSELPDITKVIIPSSVTSIHQRAFYECPKLGSATIYMRWLDSVQVIGDAFPPHCIITYAQSPSSVAEQVKTSVNDVIS